MANVLRGTVTDGLHWKEIRKSPVTYFSSLIKLTATIDPPSLAAGAGNVTAAIPVVGAKLGDRVEVFPPYSTQGIMVYGFVSSAGNVMLSLMNPTAGTIDLASGTWGIMVVSLT